MRTFLAVAMVIFFSAFCFAEDFKVIKKESYDLTLESKEIKAGSSTVEYFDIDTIGNKLPDQIFTTAETGDWVSSLPGMVYVSSADNTVDKITEYWEVSFAKVRNGGRVVFNRIIMNNDLVDRESYAWNLQVKCRYVKYK
uniref:hypothetical protein n=1 Tax=Candidatus Wunengus californicus TaxID=3367619 RepID=UPI0040291BFC